MDARLLLMLIPLLLSVLGRHRVTATFRKYHQEPNRAGVTGEWVANRLLRAEGLTHVSVRHVEGTLSDHYDPTHGHLRLSAPVAAGASVAAIGVAAHEASHAVQEAQGYRFNRVRRRIGTLVAWVSPLAGLLMLGGFLLGLPPLVIAAGAAFALMAAFALVSVPVELDASRRALDALRRIGIASAEDLRGVRTVLRAAACTYVTKLAGRVGLLLFLAAGVVSVAQIG